MTINLNPDQLRILNWRGSEGGIAGIVGPPGCGKTTTGSALAIKIISESYSIPAIPPSLPRQFNILSWSGLRFIVISNNLYV